MTPSKEKGKKHCLIVKLQASNSEELLGCCFHVNENKLTKIMFSKLFAKEITKNAITVVNKSTVRGNIMACTLCNKA